MMGRTRFNISARRDKAFANFIWEMRKGELPAVPYGSPIAVTSPALAGFFLSTTDERYKVTTDDVPYIRGVRLPSAFW